MNPAEEFQLWEYQDLGPFENHENIRLKRHPKDGRICLEKRLDHGVKNIYETLQRRRVVGIPEYFLCVENGETLIVIEKYIEGRPLSELLDGKTLDWCHLLQITEGLCHILRGLHQGEAPLICRDLKAENIIIDEDGKPWLVDFDIARFHQVGKKRDTTLLGTAEYAAPEQFGFFQTDQRTDIYALGVLMNYMATGKFPVEQIEKGALGEIIRKCTHLEPAQRYQNVEELEADLNRLKQGLGMRSHSVAKAYAFLPPGFRRGKKSAMALALTGYGLITWFCFSLKIEAENFPLTGWALWTEQASIWLAEILFIFIVFRYRGWGNRMPLLRSRNIFLRGIGLVAAQMILITCAAVFCSIKNTFFL